jgi:hypothetical protein
MHLQLHRDLGRD